MMAEVGYTSTSFEPYLVNIQIDEEDLCDPTIPLCCPCGHRQIIEYAPPCGIASQYQPAHSGNLVQPGVYVGC